MCVVFINKCFRGSYLLFKTVSTCISCLLYRDHFSKCLANAGPKSIINHVLVRFSGLDVFEILKKFPPQLFYDIQGDSVSFNSNNAYINISIFLIILEMALY